MLGTLADRERRDPVVVVSGDRDLLQLVCDDPVQVRVLYLGRGLSKATMFGPAEVAEHYGVPVDRAGPAYAELALLRGDPSDGLPGVAGSRREDGGHAAGPVRLAGAHLGRRQRPEIQDAHGVSEEAAGRRPTTSRPPGRWCGWPRRPGHAVARFGHAAAVRAPTRARSRNWPGVRRDVVDRPAAEGARPQLPRAIAIYLGRPTS